MQQVISNIFRTQALSVQSDVTTTHGPIVLLSQISSSMSFTFTMSPSQAREAAGLLVMTALAAELEADRRFKAGADAVDAAVQTSALLRPQAN
jgi:hypothetical protein